MSIFQAIGFAYTVLTCACGTFGIFYAVYQWLRRAKTSLLRGQVEEGLDVERAMEKRFFERFGVK